MRGLGVLLLCASLYVATPALADGDWHVLKPGDYHAGEAPLEVGSGWMALSHQDGLWQLRPAQPEMTPVFDPVVDHDDAHTGIRIRSAAAALVMLRLPGLSAGTVASVALPFDSQPTTLQSRHVLALPFNGQDYQLDVAPSAVQLGLGQMTTVLAGLRVDADPTQPEADSATLLWAGDLDRDGKLDLLLAYSGANRAGTCLWLSSQAEPGALVGAPNCHEASGC